MFAVYETYQRVEPTKELPGGGMFFKPIAARDRSDALVTFSLVLASSDARFDMRPDEVIRMANALLEAASKAQNSLAQLKSNPGPDS
jgi:hypothetical protein